MGSRRLALFLMAAALPVWIAGCKAGESSRAPQYYEFPEDLAQPEGSAPSVNEAGETYVSGLEVVKFLAAESVDEWSELEIVVAGEPTISVPANDATLVKVEFRLDAVNDANGDASTKINNFYDESARLEKDGRDEKWRFGPDASYYNCFQDGDRPSGSKERSFGGVCVSEVIVTYPINSPTRIIINGQRIQKPVVRMSYSDLAGQTAEMVGKSYFEAAKVFADSWPEQQEIVSVAQLRQILVRSGTYYTAEVVELFDGRISDPQNIPAIIQDFDGANSDALVVVEELAQPGTPFTVQSIVDGCIELRDSEDIRTFVGIVKEIDGGLFMTPRNLLKILKDLEDDDARLDVCEAFIGTIEKKRDLDLLKGAFLWPENADAAINMLK